MIFLLIDTFLSPPRPLTKLQRLELDGNSITSLPADIFTGFLATTRKFRLSLRNNGMTFINSRAFAHVSKLRLESLDLQGNNLVGLDFLADPCSLAFNLDAFVKVRDNQIDCDCDVYSAVVAEYVQVDGKCSKPDKYKGRWLNPMVDARFHNEAAVDCRDVSNVTEIVTCARDAGARVGGVGVTALALTTAALLSCGRLL